MKTSISIIISVYNAEKYIRQCIESVKNQDLDNIEIICVVDPCTDYTLDILKDYQQRDSRILIIENKENVGLAEARNIGFRHSNGDYIYYMDSDDYLEENVFLKLYNTCIKDDLDGIMFNSSGLVEDEGFSVPCFNTEGIGEKQNKILSGQEAFIILYQNKCYVASVWRYIWKKAFLEKNNLMFDKELRYAEDMPFTLKTLLLAKKVVITNLFVHVYRRHANSLGTKYTTEKSICMFKSFLDIYSVWLESYCEKEIEVYLYEYVLAKYKLARQYYIYNQADINVNFFMNLKQKAAFQIMLDISNLNRVVFSNEDILKIMKYERIVIYGAGNYSIDVLDALQGYHIVPTHIAITNPDENSLKELQGIPIVGISSLRSEKENILIIVAVKNKRALEEVIELLNSDNFRYIIAYESSGDMSSVN